MKFKVKYGNVEAEFDADTKEEIFENQKLFKYACYTFRDSELYASMEYFAHKDKTNQHRDEIPRDFKTQPVQKQQKNPDAPATERQKACLRSHGIQFDENITMSEASDLITKSSNRQVRP